jgi:hypothetical protein
VTPATPAPPVSHDMAGGCSLAPGRQREAPVLGVLFLFLVLALRRSPRRF